MTQSLMILMRIIKEGVARTKECPSVNRIAQKRTSPTRPNLAAPWKNPSDLPKKAAITWGRHKG